MSDNKTARYENRNEDRERTSRLHPHMMDLTMLFIVLFLLGFGLVILYSTSSYRGSLVYGDTMHWLKRQGLFAGIGVIAMMIVSRIDYHIYKNKILSWIIFGGTFMMLIATMLVGITTNGSQRWIYVGPIGFQPSEMGKIAIIIFLASFLCRHVRNMQYWQELWKPLLISVFMVGIVAVENLSTAVILMAITFVMIFVINPKYWPFIALSGIAAAGVAVMIKAQGYRMDRITAWLDPEHAENGEQTMAALYAIGSGGLFGKGLGQSMQKMILPEAFNDMIFSIVCEELGLFGAICVILLFAVLIWRFLFIAMNAPDLFGSMLVVGVIAHIGIQVFINIAVATNTMPNTGIPLPFISYGGSSLFFLLIEMGIVLSVSRYIRIRR